MIVISHSAILHSCLQKVTPEVSPNPCSIQGLTHPGPGDLRIRSSQHHDIYIYNMLAKLRGQDLVAKQCQTHLSYGPVW